MSVDVGLTTFATLSDGTCIANPSFFREDLLASIAAKAGVLSPDLFGAQLKW